MRGRVRLSAAGTDSRRLLHDRREWGAPYYIGSASTCARRQKQDRPRRTRSHGHPWTTRTHARAWARALLWLYWPRTCCCDRGAKDETLELRTQTGRDL